jgi:chemotaxis protein histidine kinase CheA
MSRIEIMEEFVMPQLSVTELLMKSLENAAKDLVTKCITECAFKHGFDASEEIKRLGVENLSLNRKQMVRKGKSQKISVTKEKKSVCPMPFIAEKVDFMGCHGLSYNRGLFTQCEKKVSNADGMNPGRFCKKCLEECDKSELGVPVCGTIQARLDCEPYEFKDTKGRSPVLYSKVIKKLQISSEKVKELQQILNPIHFQEIPKAKKARKVKEAKTGEKKSKGRPKKSAIAIETETVEDIYTKMANTIEVEEPEIVFEEEEEEYEVPVKASPKSSKKTALSEEEKEMKKLVAEEEKRIKKAEREAKLAQAKAEKEAKVAQEKAEKAAEKAVKKAQEKAEREAKIAKEKAERDAKRLQEKAERDAKKSKKPESSPTPEPVPSPTEKSTNVVKASRVEIEGKMYLKDKNSGVLYDPATRDAVGIYDEASETIMPIPTEEEEDEEEYEEGEEEEEPYEE